MPIFEKEKIIFIHIPKTGGTSVIKKYNKNYLKFKHDNFLYYKDLLQDQINNYYVFTVVRNPFERLLSYCVFHIKNYPHILKLLLRKKSETDKNLFHTYVNLMLKQDLKSRDGRSYLVNKTQTWFLINENNEIDKRIHIIKYENLNNTIQELTKENCGRYLNNMQLYYSNELKDYVYNYFLDDFLNFDYNE